MAKSLNEVERRDVFQSAGKIGIETREDGTEVIVGHAAVFYDGTDGTQYDLFGDGTVLERIMPQAFSRALSERHDVRALVNHDPNQILGRLPAGTLTLSVDRQGLRYEITPPDTQIGRDTLVSLKRGDMTGSSFAMRVREETWTEDREAGITVRQIEDVDLRDVGPVTYPAYKGADSGVAKRSLDDWRSQQESQGDENRRRRARLHEQMLTADATDLQ